MQELDVLEILKLGFIGLAFLLAFLAYTLLLIEQRREEPRPNQLAAISRFMIFSLILGIMVIGSPFIPKFFEEKPNPFMEAMLASAKNKKPMPVEFVEAQINELTQSHNKRLDSLYSQRDTEEVKLRASLHFDNVRSIESSLRRIGQYIRQENTAFDSKVRDFRSML
jgi:hypothetical protein